MLRILEPELLDRWNLKVSDVDLYVVVLLALQDRRSRLVYVPRVRCETVPRQRCLRRLTWTRFGSAALLAANSDSTVKKKDKN